MSYLSGYQWAFFEFSNCAENRRIKDLKNQSSRGHPRHIIPQLLLLQQTQLFGKKKNLLLLQQEKKLRRHWKKLRKH